MSAVPKNRNVYNPNRDYISSMIADNVESLPSTGRLENVKSLLTGGFARWVGLSLLFLAAAIVQTWPLVLHMWSSIADSPGAPGPDIYYSLWNLAWVKTAILDLQTNPYHTDYLFYPQGENLWLHPVTLVSGILSIPLQVTTNNLFFSWNVLALLFFTFSALAVYALAYRFTSNHVASVLAGFIFAFAPAIMMQFLGRWNISTTWLIPLFVLFLYRLFDTGRLREGLAAGVVWAAMLYNSQEYAMDTVVFVGLFVVYWTVVYELRKDRQRLFAFWRGIGLVGVTAFALGAPLIIGAWVDIRSDEYPSARSAPEQDEHGSADVLSFVTPSPLWGPGEDPVQSCFRSPDAPKDEPGCPTHELVGSIDNALYLGGTPLLLATLAFLTFRRSPHRVLFWFLVFLTFITLSLGPWLYIDGSKHLSLLGVTFSVPLPHQIYEQIPVLGNRRAPVRMAYYAYLPLSILAAVGLDFVMSWLRRNLRLLVLPIASLILALVVLEYWNPPVHISQLRTPDALEQIKEEPGDFAVLDAPLGRRDGLLFNGHISGANTTHYFQILHGKRTLGGFLGRIKESNRAWLRVEPGIKYLAFPSEPPSEQDLNQQIVRGVFRKYKIRYIVLHKLAPHGWPIDTPQMLGVMDNYLRNTLGLTVVHEDEDLNVYVTDVEAGS